MGITGKTWTQRRADDEGTRRHQVWYDDAETLGAKYEMAARKGVRGVAMWTANFGDDAMWEALKRFKRA